MVAVVMSTVRVREKRQITIPSDIGIKAGIEPNDILEVETTTGGILLRPVRSVTQERVNKLMKFADVCVRVPETETYKIQELHLPVYHALCLMLEEKFFGAK